MSAAASIDAHNGRAWCFVFQYEDKAPVLFGHAFVRLGATNQEIEVECWKLWDKAYPADIRRPRLIQLVPGTLVFIAEDEKKAAA